MTSGKGGPHPRQLALSLQRDGHERTDTASELLKYLRYRYELSERALVHHTKLGADAMIGKALEEWWLSLREDIATAEDGLDGSELERRASAAMEDRILVHGDDGLLEYLRDHAAGSQSAHLKAVGALVAGVLEHRLYKLAGRAGTEAAAAESMYQAFGDKAVRRDLEERACRFAGIEDSSRLILWLPPDKMRLKPAEVLVSDGSSVRSFLRYEEPRTGRGSDIYTAHRNLWSIGVYVDPDLRDDDRVKVALAWLAGQLGVRWERLNQEFSPEPSDWVDELAARRAAREVGDVPDEALVREKVREQIAARGETPETFDERYAIYREVAESMVEPPAQA